MSERIATVEDLVAAREARGLAPEDVMRQLKLAPRQLRALEAGDWPALPGHAFVRGVLRGYGRMLDVDVEPLVASMSATVHAADLRPAASLDQPLPSRSMLGFGSGGSGSRLAWALLIALAVLAFALFFAGGRIAEVGSWLSREPAAQVPAEADAQPAQAPASTSQPGTTTETLPLAPLQAPSGAGSDAPAQPGSPQGSSAVAAASVTDAVSALQASAGGAAPAAGPATADAPAAPGGAAAVPLLRLSFQVESWLEVRRDNRVLQSGNQAAGSVRELPVEGATAFVVGNAAGVRAEFQGKPLDLAPHTRGSVARFTLP